jgi:hypothetical protein
MALNCQLTGFFRVTSLASGVFDGIQKLGRCLCRPSVMLDTEGFSAFNGPVPNNTKCMMYEIFYSNIKSKR